MSERPRDRPLERRAFLRIGAAAVGGLVATGCDADGPDSARAVLRAAERWNERVERSIFRHRSIDRVPRDARVAGDAVP